MAADRGGGMHVDSLENERKTRAVTDFIDGEVLTVMGIGFSLRVYPNMRDSAPGSQEPDFGVFLNVTLPEDVESVEMCYEIEAVGRLTGAPRRALDTSHTRKLSGVQGWTFFYG